MKKFLLIFTFFTQLVYCQTAHTFYFIFNDSKLSKADITRKMNFLIQNSISRKVNFEILHFTEKQETIYNWSTNKCIVKYKPTKVGCEFQICANLSPIFSLSKTEKSKLFFTDRKVECDTGIETIILSNKDESTIIEKLNDEVDQLKKIKSPQSIYFLFNSETRTNKPSLNFKSEKIILKESEKINLSPIITGDLVEFSWLPQTGLSCTDCPNPELKATETNKYVVSAKDSSGCFTLKASIDVEVEKNCICSKVLDKVEIQFGKLPIKKFEMKTPGIKADWDWRIISNQSGGYVFDVVTNSSCAKKYRVKVLRYNGGVIFDQFYNREDVDSRSKNPYHERFPDKFVFRIDLSDDVSYKLIENTENEPYFVIEISSIDDYGDECIEKKYISPKIRPTKCN